MSPVALLEQLMSARQQLDSACSLLLKPSADALDCCATLLEDGSRQLAELQPGLGQQAENAEALEEAWRLRRSFVRASRLMHGANDFHQNWLQLRGAMTGGYMKSGEPAPVLHNSRICLHG